MSAAGRGSGRERLEFYSTPKTLCAAVCARLPIDGHARILEPSAGAGPWVASLRAGRPAAHIEAIEINPTAKPVLFSMGASRAWIGNFETWRNRDPSGLGFSTATAEERPLFDWIVGNPPYARPTGRHSPTTGRPIMEECVRDHVARSMSLLKDGGQLAFLLRLNWYAPASRDKLLAEHPLKRLIVLKERPKFTGRGTDATEYAIFWWQKGYRGETAIERMGGGPWKD